MPLTSPRSQPANRDFLKESQSMHCCSRRLIPAIHSSLVCALRSFCLSPAILGRPRTWSLLGALILALTTTDYAWGQHKKRARELGIPFEGTPGKCNAITDVPGVEVGHTTLNEGQGKHAVRTGVTAIWPRRKDDLTPV